MAHKTGKYFPQHEKNTLEREIDILLDCYGTQFVNRLFVLTRFVDYYRRIELSEGVYARQ